MEKKIVAVYGLVDYVEVVKERAEKTRATGEVVWPCPVLLY